ncbi:hypothetical protein [Nocardia sp. AG03]|uniref:hypothetical protein n=1 Tax=Nocardia sp. AG03 TaxID=3025312 RepID=UPI002418812E|nr:hypothetical protein [Nocardia sp. AG03]
MARSVPQPPFPSELLADLHADNLAPELSEQLWPQVETDPDALRYLNDLDDVNAHLRALSSDDRVVHRMPDDVADRMFRFVAELDAGEGPAERLTTALAADLDDGPTERLTTAALGDSVTGRLGTAPDDGVSERLDTAPPHPTSDPAPISLDAYRSRSRRRMSLLAAAAAAVVVLAGAGAVITTLDTTEGTPTAAPALDPSGDDLTTAAALSALGKRDVRGPLSDEAALTRCVLANGIDRGVLGASSITFRGGEAVLVLVQGPAAPTITALVVGPGCGTGAPEQLALRDIG